MKNKHIFALIFVMLVPVIFSSCGHKPPPPPQLVVIQPDIYMPLTFSILQRLGRPYDSGDLGRYQLVLVGKIIMERDSIVKRQVVESGRSVFKDVLIKEVLTINDRTKGQALSMANTNGRAVLRVCFEEVGGYYQENYYLEFSCVADERESFYHLDFTPDLVTSVRSSEKGTVEYGKKTYKLKFTGETKPYLLINLFQKDKEKLLPRTVPGRVVY